MELNIPVIVLAQLNRKPEESNAEPALHHLRESGSIEQDADVVMLLSRESATDETENNSPSEDGEAQPIAANVRGIPCKLNIAKQRNGPCDRIRLLSNPATPALIPFPAKPANPPCHFLFVLYPVFDSLRP